MDLLDYVPSWSDVERNLDRKFSALNQSVNRGMQTAHDGWDGFTRRVSSGASQAYGYMGGNRIDHVRKAMALSYPIMQTNLSRKWASINIDEILPVLLKLMREIVMILGGSVAVGGAVGGAVGSLALGAGALPGAVVGSGIGLQVGNLILMGLGLAAIGEYFYQGLPACLSTLQQGLATAWNAQDGLKPAGLDPSGGSSAAIQDRTERAARQLARGQEQLVLLLLTAIVAYLTRGQIKAGVNSVDSIITRSANLQVEIRNKQLADWLAKYESKILAQQELKIRDAAPLNKTQESSRENASRTKSSSKTKYEKRKDISYRSAAEVNSTFPEGWSPPYKPGTRVTEFTSTVDDVYVRVHGENNMARSWMMKRESIMGLTPEEIKSKFALPELPTFMSEVSVPAGTRIRTGIVNPLFGGVGNATQYELLERLPMSAFNNTVRL